MNYRSVSSALRRPLLVAATQVAALLLPASTGANPQFAQPGEIEGVVTKAPGGTSVKGVEICAFDVEVTKTLVPRKLSTFRLPIPDDLDSLLERLDSSRSLTLELHAQATKVEGRVSTDRLSVRLPGRG